MKPWFQMGEKVRRVFRDAQAFAGAMKTEWPCTKATPFSRFQVAVSGDPVPAVFSVADRVSTTMASGAFRLTESIPLSRDDSVS